MQFLRLPFVFAIALSALTSPAYAGAPAISQQRMVKDLIEHVRGTSKGDTQSYGPCWGDHTEGSWASQRLLAIGKAAEPALIEAVADRDPWVQMWAIETLGRMKCRAAIPAIVRQLETSEEPAVLAAAANAVRRMKAREGFPGLMRAAKMPPDDHNRPCGAAAEALGVIRDPHAIPVLESLLDSELPPNPSGHFWGPDYRPAVALAEFGHRAIPILEKAINGNGKHAPLAAVRALATIKHKDVVPILLRALGIWFLRDGAVYELASLRDKRALPSYVALLDDEDDAVVANAADGVAGLGAEVALPLLRKAFARQMTLNPQHPDKLAVFWTDYAFQAMLLQLCRLGDQASVSAFEEALQIEKRTQSEETRDRREWLIIAIAWLRGREALPSLLASLGAVERKRFAHENGVPEPYVIDRCYARAIAMFGPDGMRATANALKSGLLNDEQASLVVAVLDRDREFEDAVVGRSFTTADKRTFLKPALSFLKRSTGMAKREILNAVCRVPMPEARNALLALLDDADPGVQLDAAHGLALIGDPAAIRPLAAEFAAKEDDPRTKPAAFGKFDSRAVPEIYGAMFGSKPKLRKCLLLTLAQTQAPEAVPALARALDSEDQELVRAAAKGLRLIDTAEAREALRKHDADLDIHVRWEVFLALADPKHRPPDPPERITSRWDRSTWFTPDDSVGS
jgi:HEAT repeat protein